MTEYVRQNHNVAIAEKRVDTALSLVSPQYRGQRRTSATRAVRKSDPAQSRSFWL